MLVICLRLDKWPHSHEHVGDTNWTPEGYERNEEDIKFGGGCVRGWSRGMGGENCGYIGSRYIRSIYEIVNK